jgi:hypothetical protein
MAANIKETLSPLCFGSQGPPQMGERSEDGKSSEDQEQRKRQILKISPITSAATTSVSAGYFDRCENRAKSAATE